MLAAPSRALAATAVLVVAAVAGAAALHDGVPAAVCGASALLLVLAVAGLHRRADRAALAPAGARWAARAVTLLAAGSAVELVLRVVAELVGPGHLSPVLSPVLPRLVATVLLYRGVVDWNRARSVLTDPGDWLNGIGAVLVVVAATNLVLSRRAPLTEDLWWDVQLSSLTGGALLVTCGALVTVAGMNRAWRDPRTWLVLGGAVAALGGHTAAAVLDPATVTGSAGGWASTLSTAGWTVLGLALLCSAVSGTPAPAQRPGASTTGALTAGALVVLGGGVAVLALLPLWPGSGATAAAWAVLAVAAVSARIVHLVRDLSHLAQHRQEARTDDLTGLPNRRELTVVLGALAQRQRRVALLVLDLDGFKEVNDRYGHGTGDELLTALAPRFAAAVGDGLLARCGGDEFAVVLPGSGVGEATDVAHALVAACAAVHLDVPAAVDGGPVRGVRVGVSVGVVATDALTDPVELLRRADTAMYAAKAGGAGVGVYDRATDERSRERLLLLDELRAALAEGPDAFEVHYQPQVDTRTGATTGAEALVRWRHPRLGLLGPLAFLDLVEGLGAMPALTAVVLRTAATDLAGWRSRGHPDLRVSVNLSAGCLGEPDLVRALLDVLPRGTTPRDVVLEVTETTLMADPAAALEVCQRLTAAGFGLSLDDYGTGFSTLSYLSDLPATELKVDRSFTARVLTDERVRAVVAGTVALGHQLGLHVVAEGAEDATTLDAMAALGCDAVQGYVHARPAPAAELTRWLAGRAVGTGRPVRS